MLLVTVAVADVEPESEEVSLSFARMLASAGTEAELVAGEASVVIEESVEVADTSVDESADVASASEAESALVGEDALVVDISVSVVEVALSVVLLELVESVSVEVAVPVEVVDASPTFASLALTGSKAATSLGPPTTETAGPAGVNTKVTLLGSEPRALAS